MFTQQEIIKLETYLKTKFGNQQLQIMPRKTDDSVEVLLSGEFIAFIYKDEEDGDVSYDMNMAILSSDLPN